MAPHADHLYACDARWWEHHGVEVVEKFAGRRWTHDKMVPDPEQHAVAKRFGIEMQRGVDAPGLGRTMIHFGSNGGYQAINLAYLLGAGRIILLGYDMQRTGGKAHWFGDHPGVLNSGSAYTDWIGNFRRLAKDLATEGVEVINCSRETALDCFPRMTIAEALCLTPSAASLPVPA